MANLVNPLLSFQNLQINNSGIISLDIYANVDSKFNSYDFTFNIKDNQLNYLNLIDLKYVSLLHWNSAINLMDGIISISAFSNDFSQIGPSNLYIGTLSFLSQNLSSFNINVLKNSNFSLDDNSFNLTYDQNFKISQNIFNIRKMIGSGPSTVAFGTTDLGYAIQLNSGSPIQITFSGTNASDNAPGAGWSGIGAAVDGSGYNVYLKNTNGTYAMWNSNASGVVTGGKALTGIDIYTAETALNMDLTGDGIIGSSAKITGNLQLDMNNLDLSRLISYSYQSNSYNNINYNGKSYKDVLEVNWKYNGNYYSSIFGGYDLTYYTNAQNYKVITSGIVTGYLELYWNGSQWMNSWGVENISISATEIFNDAITLSTVDDYSTFQKILTGNDNIIGSPYNDTLYGGLGSDTFNGGGGSDIFCIKNNESLISSFDIITDFNYNDLLKIGRTVSVGGFISKSIVGTGSLENDLTSTLAGQALNFIQSSAALIAITGSNSDAGTYAIIANHTNSNPGFVAATDTVIKLQNYQQGSLTAYSFIF